MIGSGFFTLVGGSWSAAMVAVATIALMFS